MKKKNSQKHSAKFTIIAPLFSLPWMMFISIALSCLAGSNSYTSHPFVIVGQRRSFYTLVQVLTILYVSNNTYKKGFIRGIIILQKRFRLIRKLKLVITWVQCVFLFSCYDVTFQYYSVNRFYTHKILLKISS